MTTPSVSCPLGGSFYACASGSSYVGCCLTNPCDTGCFAGQLVPAAFEASQYGQFPDQQCNSDASAFYTCIYENQNNATFWGCCDTNACSGGSCSGGDLAGAFLSNNPQEAAPFLSLNSSWLATATLSRSAAPTEFTSSTSLMSISTPAAMSSARASSTSVSLSSAEITSGATAEASSTPASLPVAQHSSNSTGAIAGGAVGGFAVLAGLILGLVWLLRRRRSRTPSPDAMSHETVMEKQDQGPAQALSTAKQTPTLMDSASMSPHPPYSPGPPSYISESDGRHMSYELAGTTQWELDGGQRYHAYRPIQGLGVQEHA